MGLVTKDPTPPPAGWEAWIDALYPIEPGTSENAVDFAERILKPAARLRLAKLFCRHDKLRLTLGQVIDDYCRTGSVRVIREPAPSFVSDERLILWVGDKEDLDTLTSIFGAEAIEDASDWLVEQKRLQKMASLPRLATLELPHSEAIVSVPIEADGLSGSVGLSATHPGIGACETRVRLCKDLHVVFATHTPSTVSLAALIDDERLVMSDTWYAIAEDPGEASRAKAIEAAIPALVEALCAAWPSFEDETLRTARRHALDLLVERWRDVDQKLEGLECRPWSALLGLPLFPAVDGEHYSVGTLMQRSREQEKPVAYLHDDTVRGETLEEGAVVLALPTFELRRLQELPFLACRDFSRQWEKDQEVIAWRRRAEPLPDPAAIEAIHRISVSLPGGVKGELAIPATRLRQGVLSMFPEVSIGAEGKLIEAKAVSKVFPCCGVIDGTRSVITRDLKSVVLPPPLRRKLEDAAHSLYVGLCDRFEAGGLERPGERDIARSYLAAALFQLLTTERTVDTRWAPLLKRLEVLPIILLDNGQAVSLEVVRRERPRNLKDLELWAAPPKRVKPVPETVPTSKRMLQNADLAALSPSRSTRPSEKKKPPKPTPSAPPTPRKEEIEKERETSRPPPHPPAEDLREARFVEAVRQQLRLVRGENRSLLSDENIGRIELGSALADVAVTCDDWSTTINRRHSAVELALERFDQDPIWVAFIASSVFTAVNVFLSEVTDSDEELFHDLLAQLVGA